MSSQLAKHLITADEYERMGEAGIFGDVRLELIEGDIFTRSPIGSAHAACVNYLSMTLSRLLGDRLIVITQNPIRLSDFSEPQPDVALVRWRDDFYRGDHPRPEDVLLVVEVADSTVQVDRAVKVPLYARSGIPEAWIVSIPDGQVEVYAGLAGGAYKVTDVFSRAETVRAHAVPDVALKVSDLLG